VDGVQCCVEVVAELGKTKNEESSEVLNGFMLIIY
jgi:hypothetical protein